MTSILVHAYACRPLNAESKALANRQIDLGCAYRDRLVRHAMICKNQALKLEPEERNRLIREDRTGFTARGLWYGTYWLAEEAAAQSIKKRWRRNDGRYSEHGLGFDDGRLGAGIQNTDLVMCSAEYGLRGPKLKWTADKFPVVELSCGKGLSTSWTLKLHRPLPMGRIVRAVVTRRRTSSLARVGPPQYDYSMQFTIRVEKASVEASFSQHVLDRPASGLRTGDGPSMHNTPASGFSTDDQRAAANMPVQGLNTCDTHSIDKTPVQGLHTCDGKPYVLRAAIDIGWWSESDTIRCYDLIDENGTHVRQLLPEHLRAKHFHTHSIEAIRDKGRDGLKMKTWVARAVDDPEAEARRKQIAHLDTWAISQERHVVRARDEFYRQTARELCSKYAEIFIEDFSLAKISRRKKGDGKRYMPQNRVLGAPGRFREILRSVALKFGTVITEVPSAGTTQTCSLCGDTTPWESAAVRERCCVACGETYERPWNSARNILAFGTTRKVDAESAE